MAALVILALFTALLIVSERPWSRRHDPTIDNASAALRAFQKRREG